MTDPIADMLTRIRNAQAVSKEEVVLPMSKIKFALGKILVQEGFLEKVEEVKTEGSKFGELKIVLKYIGKNKPAITSLKRVSRPSLRVYRKKDNLPVVLNNLGIAVISTPNGLMTNKEAKKKGFGGEIICEVY